MTHSALAAAVTNLANDPKQLQQLADNSLRAAPNYSRQKQARDMLAVLSDVDEANRKKDQ